MHKYLRVFVNIWGEIFTYRLNFAMWRFRVVLQLLTVYFLWSTLLMGRTSIFGYTTSQMLTYVLGTSFISSIVLSTRTFQIGEQINDGTLSNFLIKPISYIIYWFAYDLGDKAMNIFFSIIELTLILFIFRPPLFLQANPLFLFLGLLATFLAVLLYFFFGFLLGLLGFWSNETWGPRFIFFIIINFFAGSLFPLDILPKGVFKVLELLPFPYLLYFPLKIYLGQLPLSAIIQGLFVSTLWVGVLYLSSRFIWLKGLKLYGAEGR